MSTTPLIVRNGAGHEPADDMLDALPAEGIQPATTCAPAHPVLEVLPAAEVDVQAPRAGILRRTWGCFTSVAEWLFGAAALILGLSILSAIPLVQLLTLGYLLEAGGRVARTGRLRDGFIGMRQAARLGTIAIGCVLVWLPLYLISSMAASAQVIDPEGEIAQRWEAGLTIATVAGAVHIVAACARGGKLRYFFWPFNVIWFLRRLWRGGYYAQARDTVWDFVVALRLPYYFWLGFRGFVGAFIWLAIPVWLLGMSDRNPFLGIMGGFAMAFVLLYLPFLQMRFARENRFRAMFEWRAVRGEFCRAPVAFFVALLLTLAFALPLYLMKIEMIPREIVFLESLVFIVFIFPARLMTGWASARSVRREEPRHWFFRWTSRLLMLPTVAFYVLIVYFTQHLAWGGVSSLYEQHAFLLPVPFLNMHH